MCRLQFRDFHDFSRGLRDIFYRSIAIFLAHCFSPSRYFLGTQEEGREFADDWGRDGALGAVDYSSFEPTGAPGAVGFAALRWARPMALHTCSFRDCSRCTPVFFAILVPAHL